MSEYPPAPTSESHWILSSKFSQIRWFIHISYKTSNLDPAATEKKLNIFRSYLYLRVSLVDKVSYLIFAIDLRKSAEEYVGRGFDTKFKLLIS